MDIIEIQEDHIKNNEEKYISLNLKSSFNIKTNIQFHTDSDDIKCYKKFIQSVIRRQLSNKRSRTTQPKTRSEVAGSMRKISGVNRGRSRAGTSKVPQFRGGGSTKKLGTSRFKLKINKKELLKAKEEILKDYSRNNKLLQIKEVENKTQKNIINFTNLGINNKKILFVYTKEECIKGVRNIKNLKTIEADRISPLQLVNRDVLVFTHNAYLAHLQKYEKK